MAGVHGTYGQLRNTHDMAFGVVFGMHFGVFLLATPMVSALRIAFDTAFRATRKFTKVIRTGHA